MKHNMHALGVALVAAMDFGATLGCGGDDAGDAKDPASTADAAAPCPELEGTWTIMSHCNAALVGMTVPVTQSDCVLSTGGTFAGLSGPVGPFGRFDLSGSIAGSQVTCSGTATARLLTESCTGDCNVTLSR